MLRPALDRGDPRQGRFVTVASLRWVIRHRAWTPYYLVRYWRFLVFKLRNPRVVTEGFVFLGRRVEVRARRGYGRVVLGRWVHIGDGNKLRAHEGTLRIGDKCVFGAGNTINCQLDIEFGAATIVADWVYVCDFDHVFTDVHVPIKDQGIVKAPVRVGPGSWIGVRATVLKGVTVGAGSVVAAHTVVTRDVPKFSVVAGTPGRVVGDRQAAMPPPMPPPIPPAIPPAMPPPMPSAWHWPTPQARPPGRPAGPRIAR